jgi:hypothetical protein
MMSLANKLKGPKVRLSKGEKHLVRLALLAEALPTDGRESSVEPVAVVWTKLALEKVPGREQASKELS